MRIYFKCSFKKSRLGYRVSVYDSKTGHQIATDSDLEQEIYKNSICKKIYNYEIGKTIFLATDQNGDMFLAVLGLVEGQFDRYVNAIFCDTDANNIYKLFLTFCSDYENACKTLLDSMQRNDDGDIGYRIDDSMIRKLCHEAENGEPEINIPQQSKEKLIALISEDDTTYYETELKRFFENQDFEKCQLDSSKKVSKEFIKRLNDKVKKEGAVGKFSKIIIFVAIIVLVLLIMLLRLCGGDSVGNSNATILYVTFSLSCYLI